MVRTEHNKAALSWRQKDFIKATEIVPDCLLHDTLHTEGELMNEEEVLQWVADTIKTFQIIKEQNSAVFDKLYSGFATDVNYLVSIGKIKPDEAVILLSENNFV